MDLYINKLIGTISMPVLSFYGNSQSDVSVMEKQSELTNQVIAVII